MENSTVFLGVTLDCKLQWGAHIETLAGKLSSDAYAVRKIRQITDVEVARLVYFAYFHSAMSYGILLRGKAADIETIFILQKRTVRSIYKLKSRESLREKFKEIVRTPLFATLLTDPKEDNSDQCNDTRQHKKECGLPVTQTVTNLEPKAPDEAWRHALGRWFWKWPAMMHSCADRGTKAKVTNILTRNDQLKSGHLLRCRLEKRSKIVTGIPSEEEEGRWEDAIQQYFIRNHPVKIFNQKK
ncbi:jg2594 [Pararge aegeria aegeria]|uniref:Jg2594 protein n=1 Tax=Pararge aegeria aegeria TaxID=348720 RepID=A0A8S4SAI4_9NEOP|nr:jg2594 [Pararge aegeria aegeria]